MEHQLVDKGAQPWSTSTPRHTPENCFRPIDPPEDGFSSIEDAKEYALDVSDISDTPCLELVQRRRDRGRPTIDRPTT